jgi:uncharacterized protein
MGSERLPTFRYHPDPLTTGSVKPSNNVCVRCGTSRGYVYSGPAYGEGDHQDDICPWCIADGSAHDSLGVSFTDKAGIGGYGDWKKVTESVANEVAFRTPGFAGWQQERWFTCCGDAAAFLGRAGRRELSELGPEAVEAIRQELGWDGMEWSTYLSQLDKDGSPTAYVFRCLHCSKLGGYSDFT